MHCAKINGKARVQGVWTCAVLNWELVAMPPTRNGRRWARDTQRVCCEGLLLGRRGRRIVGIASTWWIHPHVHFVPQEPLKTWSIFSGNVKHGAISVNSITNAGHVVTTPARACWNAHKSAWYDLFLAGPAPGHAAPHGLIPAIPIPANGKSLDKSQNRSSSLDASVWWKEIFEGKIRNFPAKKVNLLDNRRCHDVFSSNPNLNSPQPNPTLTP